MKLRDFNKYSDYRKTSSILSHGLRMRTDAVADLLLRIDKDKSLQILDVGSADGAMLQNLCLQFPNATFVGLDANLDLCHKARQVGINIIHGNACQLPFLDNTYDIVLLCATLKHIENYRAVLREYMRVLTEGGFIIYSDPTPVGIRLGIWLGHFNPTYLIMYGQLSKLVKILKQ